MGDASLLDLHSNGSLELRIGRLIKSLCTIIRLADIDVCLNSYRVNCMSLREGTVWEGPFKAGDDCAMAPRFRFP